MSRNASVFFFVSILFLYFSLSAPAQNLPPPYINPVASQWADSVFNTLTIEEKIGQLFIVETRSDKDTSETNRVSQLVNQNKIGGLIFFKGGPVRQAALTNYYQSISKIPLLISIDGEWGLAMRLDSTIRFPRQMTLSAIPGDSMIYKFGSAVARQCRRMGIHTNFSPDVDINNNALNPIINSRSFGEDREQVARKGIQYVRALQDHQVLGCAKHFPGHGNTDTDSHLALPVIRQNAEELDTVELYPFRQLIRNGVGSIMAAHLHVPALDSMDGSTSSLSKRIITEQLKKKMGYQGLVMTDALTMKGVTDFFRPGDLDLRALQAGNDMLLMSENVPVAVNMIRAAIDSGQIDSVQVFTSVKKVLMVKHWCGLADHPVITLENLQRDLHTPADEQLNYDLYGQAITLLKNYKNTLPLTDKEEKTASLVINDSLHNIFQQTLELYAPVSSFVLSKDADTLIADSMVRELKKFDKVIISIHNTTTRAYLNFGISPVTNYIIQKLNNKTKTITCVFGNSYCFTQLPDAIESDALILAYEDTWLPQWIVPQIIYGAMNTNGRLPVTPVAEICRGDGDSLQLLTQSLQYALPASAGVSDSLLAEIDSLAQDAITKHAMPGCEILVAAKGKVVYNKAFGYHTYDNTEAVKTTDLYDIASVTKVAATALATMRLYEKGKIDLNEKISHYLPDLKKTNKQDITILEMLTHSAGLQAWIPFYKNTLAGDSLSAEYYSKTRDKKFSIQVTDSLYLRDDYRDTIWKAIIESPVTEKGKYVYSDLGLLIMQRIVEKLSHKSLDEYVQDNFYNKLGLHRMLFHPEEKYSLNNIIPTESDSEFRKQLVHGTVHDPAAAMLGGVAGNAGIFSDANSLAVLMQLLLNGGEYGGMRYFKKETVELFTRQQTEGNRRGIIFDKPEPDKKKNGPTAKDASPLTFGHTGFTGTCIWADPEKEMVFVFLSNRVYPTATNNKLVELNVRTNMMQKIYDAMK